MSDDRPPSSGTSRAFTARLVPEAPARPIALLLIGVAGLVALGVLGPERAQPVAERERVPPGTGDPAPPRPTDRPPPTLPPGPVTIVWGSLSLEVTVPAGWSRARAGATLYKLGRSSRPEAPTFAVHGVRRVVTDVCAEQPGHEPVGPTMADLTRALVAQQGTVLDGPRRLIIGGHPGTRIGLTVSADCGGRDGHRIWTNSPATGFGIMRGGTAVVYIVDVRGLRVVMTAHQRGATPEDVAELYGIVGSLRITTAASDGVLAEYLDGVAKVCEAATRRFELEVVDLIDPGGHEAVAGFRSLAEGAEWAATAARIGEESLADLQEMPVRARDREPYARRLAELQPTIEILRAAAYAAAAGDAESFNRLMLQRVEETHRKDRVLGESFWSCPVELPA